MSDDSFMFVMVAIHPSCFVYDVFVDKTIAVDK